MSAKRPLRLFFDRCFGGRRLREVLHAGGLEADIVLHDDVFPRNTDDAVWAKWAAQEGFLVFSCDLFRNEFQRETLESYEGLVLIFPELPVDVTAGLVIRCWPRILHLVTHEATGCYRVSGTTGKLKRRGRT